MYPVFGTFSINIGNNYNKIVAFYKKNLRESKHQQQQQQQQQNTTIFPKDRIQGTESKAPNQKHRIKSTENVYS